MFADGELAAKRLISTMQDSVADGLSHPMVVRLSRLRKSQHAHATLLELLEEHTAVLDDIELVSGSSGDRLLKPSSIIGRLFRHYPDGFVRLLGADPGRVRSFWMQLFREPNVKFLREHHYLRNLSMDELAYVVPMVLHEDAAPVTKMLSSNMLSSSSLLGLGNEKVTQLLHATYIKRKKADGEDHGLLWAALMADFEGLMQNDQASRGPWRFLLLFALADEEVRCVEWGLTSWGAANECCSECRADRQKRPWTDMRRGSSWRGTESFTLEAYRGRFRRPLHPLSASKFVWRFFFFLDSMHVFDCKGAASTIFGSVLSTLVRDVRLGANQQQRLDLINTRLRSFYSRNPKLHKLPKITLNNLEGSNGWAELVGSAIKAAQTRAAAPFFAELAREFFNSDTPEDLNTCRATSSMRDIYDKWCHVLDPGRAEALR